MDEESAAQPRPGSYDQAWYQLSDPQGSVVSVINVQDAETSAVGVTVDRMEYDPYGNVRRTKRADMDHSGSVTINDYYMFLAAWFATTPTPASDTDENGVFGSSAVNDLFLYMSLWFDESAGGDPTARARVGGLYAPAGSSLAGRSTASDNPYGYCGYMFDDETAAAKVLGPDNPTGIGYWGGGLYHVRHRVYDPQQGRWLTRDPAGFVDGMNLYEYCGGGSVSCFDPMGLECDINMGGGIMNFAADRTFRLAESLLSLNFDDVRQGFKGVFASVTIGRSVRAPLPAVTGGIGGGAYIETDFSEGGAYGLVGEAHGAVAGVGLHGGIALEKGTFGEWETSGAWGFIGVTALDILSVGVAYTPAEDSWVQYVGLTTPTPGISAEIALFIDIFAFTNTESAVHMMAALAGLSPYEYSSRTGPSDVNNTGQTNPYHALDESAFFEEPLLDESAFFE